MKTPALLAGALVVASALALTQAVRLDRSGGFGADSPYNRLYNSRNIVTFEGRVTGLQVGSPMSNVGETVSLLVKASNGGTALVDLGPRWFVDNQVAKVKVGDRVRVTGSKVLVNGRGLILASNVVRNGLVLGLRRPNGSPYWVAYQTTPNPPVPSNATPVTGTIQSFESYTINGVPHESAVLETNNGTLRIDLGPQWFYSRQNVIYQPGDNLVVYTGPNPVRLPGNVTIVPSNVIIRGNEVYTLRLENGAPVYYWYGGR